MAYIKFPVGPGVFKDDSPTAAENYLIDADKIRFVRGKPETMYGWEKFATSAVLGYARGIHTWADISGNKYVGIGTHLRLYAYDVDGNKYDITPVTTRGELSAPFTTSAGSTTITVAHTNHGLVENQKVSFSNASAVGGVTINGEYVVNASPATSTYTITHTAAASSSASGGGTVDYEYFLAPGLADSLGGTGYGTGGYGTGGYGVASSVSDLVCRTWSLDNWGQNLLANPSAGSIYEWAPNVTASELVTNGGLAYSTASGWTIGTGWSISSTNAVGSVATGDMTQTITLNRGAWHLLKYNVTVTSGSVYACIGTTTVNTSSASQRAKAVFWSGAGGSAVLKFTGGSFTGTIDDVSVKVLTTAHKLPAAPSNVNGIFVTPERILGYFGCPDDNYNADPLRVGWTDQGDNQAFTTTASNFARNYPLSHGTKVVNAVVGNGQNFIQTDTALYSMRYAYDPNIVYTFDLVATGCGVAGPNAAALLNGTLYWRTPQGEFMVSAGGQPTALDSTIKRDVADHMSWVQSGKIFASPINKYGEVIWLYPDQRDGNECSRYALVNQQNQWAPGTFARTCWADAGVFEYPLAVDTDGYVWYHEKGDSEDGAARTWYFETAYFDLADGQFHAQVNGIRPDHEDLLGGYSITVYTRSMNVQGVHTRTFGPYSITNNTGNVSTRIVGQQFKVRWSGNDAPTYYRQGTPSFDVYQTKRVR